MCDLRLHQLVTVRVAGATPAAASRLSRLLPGRRCETNGERPDLVLRQVDRLALAPASGRIGQVAFDGERLVLQRRGRDGARRVAVALDHLGSGCEIVAEGDLPDADLVVLLLRGAALGVQVLPLHGAVFEYGGAGVVVTGWPGSTRPPRCSTSWPTAPGPSPPSGHW